MANEDDISKKGSYRGPEFWANDEVLVSGAGEWLPMRLAAVAERPMILAKQGA